MTLGTMNVGIGTSPVGSNLAFIDALRGLAALYVVICHVGFIPSPALTLAELETRFVHAGHTGVILFFLVSSFTLSLSSTRRHDEKNHLGRFYVRRLFRILPLFYVSVLLACLRDYYLHGFVQPPNIIFSNLVGVFQPGKTDGMVWASWTLGIELTFYLVFPFLFALARNLRRALTVLLIVVGFELITTQALMGKQANTFDDSSIRFTIGHNLPYFIIGMVFYFLFKRQQENGFGGRRLGYLATYSALGMFLGLLIWYPWIFTTLASGGHYLVTACMLLFMLGLLFHPTSLVVNPITCFFGKISYSLYLLHPPLVFLLIPVFRSFYAHGFPNLIAFSLCFLLTLAVLVPIATASYLFVEVPGVKLGSNLIKRYL